MTLDNLFTVNKSSVKDDEGTLYLLYIDIDGKEISKIGITSRDKPQTRWLEILGSIITKYRELHYFKPKRYRKTEKVREKESKILDYLSEYKYSPEKKVQGHTEMVLMDRELVVDIWERVYEGKELVEDGEECSVCGKKKKFGVEGELVCGHRCSE